MIQANYKKAQGGFWWVPLAAAAVQYLGTQSQNKANEASTAKQLAFQQSSLDQSQNFARDLSSTAHQREVKDLRAAGLNPVLSGTGGMGSASPSASGMPGAQFSSQNPAGAAMSTAMDVRRNKAEVDNMEKQNRLIEEQSDETRARRNLLGIDYNVRLKDANLRQQEYESEAQRTDILRNQAKGQRLEGDIDSTTYGEIMRYIDRAKNSVSPFSSARQLFNQGASRPPARR